MLSLLRWLVHDENMHALTGWLTLEKSSLPPVVQTLL